MIVIDASIVATALADDGDDGRRLRHHLSGELIAPHVIDLEVTSTWRRTARAGHLTEQRVRQALQALRDLPLARVPHQRLMPRVWEMRENLTTYDAAYVALAELAGAPLITADAHLARAPGVRCEIALVR